MDEVFPDLTEDVIARMKNGEPRLREVVTLLVRHLHAFAREASLTQVEWRAGIDFLTRTGQMCSEARQEFILLSDTLGVSMLVDAINHRREGGGTESTVLGPFYVPGAQRMPLGASISKDGVGEPMLVSGRVIDTAGQPIADATLDVWQTA